VPTALKRKSRDTRKQLKEHPGSREKTDPDMGLPSLTQGGHGMNNSPTKRLRYQSLI